MVYFRHSCRDGMKKITKISVNTDGIRIETRDACIQLQDAHSVTSQKTMATSDHRTLNNIGMCCTY
jgi:hypothetical protein